MPYSSSSSSSSDARSSESSSGRSLDGETHLPDKVVVALEASQASMDSAKVSFFRCPHGLSFTTLRVEFLGTKHLARPFLFWEAALGVSKTFSLALSLLNGILTYRRPSNFFHHMSLGFLRIQRLFCMRLF